MMQTRRIRLKMDNGEAIAIDKIFSPPTKEIGWIVKKNRESSTINGLQSKAVKKKAKIAKYIKCS